MGGGGKQKQGMSCERLERIERFVDDNYIATAYGTLSLLTALTSGQPGLRQRLSSLTQSFWVFLSAYRICSGKASGKPPSGL
jgi:hypothetical protein